MAIRTVQPLQLTNILKDKSKKVKLIDCRSFIDYNDNHIIGSVNICCSKLIKRRLQQDKISLRDLLVHCRIEIDETSDIIVYDQHTASLDDCALDSFIYVLLKKLILVFEKVCMLSGGFLDFHAKYPQLCENMIWKCPTYRNLVSQPSVKFPTSLPATSSGPTRILPFLYLGSEEDAGNRELLQSHNITYELNVSNKCPKPDFISDGHFLRIPVNDSHNEKLLPYFNQTFQFVEKVRESHECALIHCLAGISRSPTVAIAYIMRHLAMNCEEAYRYVKSKRATISPNFNFLGQLLEYEQQLVAEKILENKKIPASISTSSSCQVQAGSTSVSQSVSSSSSAHSDFFLGPSSSTSSSSTALSSSSASSSSSSCHAKSTGKRLNLSLRISPFSSSSGSGCSSLSSKDSSPTTAMARLQFSIDNKPLGKENRTVIGSSVSSSSGTSSSSTGSGMGLNFGSLGCFSLSRPTRLVKEQNVTSIQEEEIDHWESVTKSITKQSVSVSISKGFKSRKSSIEQPQQQQVADESSPTTLTSSRTEMPLITSIPTNTCTLNTSNTSDDSGCFGNVKKCRVHNIIVETTPDSSSASTSLASSSSSMMKRSLNEKQSLHHTNSSGSNISNPGATATTTTTTACSSNAPSSRVSMSDESGIQSSISGSSVVCSPLGYNKRDYLRSDSVSTSGISEISDHDLLASSGSWDMAESHDDGVFSDNHSLFEYSKSPKSSRQVQLWSDSGNWTDEGVFSCSCSSSTVEVPLVSHTQESKSPEKRKCSEYLFPSQKLSNQEKRRSYVGGVSSSSSTTSDWPGDSSRKRWSLADDAVTISDLQSSSASNNPGRWKDDLETTTTTDMSKKKEKIDKIANTSSSNSHLNFGHWFKLLSGREFTCCERRHGLYRVQSCPGICTRESSSNSGSFFSSNNEEVPEPHEPNSDSALLKMRCCRNRIKHLGHHHDHNDHCCNTNRFSCGIDYDELWAKLRKIHDSKNNESHSSSSTLASSSSYSIVVQ